jgi:hypothetical protein
MKGLEIEAARAAVNKMLSQGHFSICTIDQILRMTGGVPPKREYEILRTLHCVDYKDMSQRLRIELPRLIQLVLESQPIHLELQEPPRIERLLEFPPS